jgi:hypothetical protein
LNGWNGLNQPLMVGAIAGGNLNYVQKVKSELGFKAARREVIDEGSTYALREEGEAYGSNLSVK